MLNSLLKNWFAKRVSVKIPFSSVAENRKKNAHHQWLESSNPNLETAYRRLRDRGYVKVWNQPKFQLRPGDSVFTIGSCFARNIEERLVDAGFSVPTRDIRIDPDYYDREARPNAILNKYNTHSIFSEVEQAFRGSSPVDNGLVSLDDELWFDPLASHLKPNRREILDPLRRQIRDLTKGLGDADAIFITLGQNEVWLDETLQLYLNMPPPPQAMKRYRDRYSVVLADFEENQKALRETIGLIHRFSRKDPKIIITVSPVPMGNTLSGQDVIAANHYSKSMLRVCAESLARDYSFVDYFPSYEMVLYSDPALAWHEDTLHVQNGMVHFVVEQFVERYVPGGGEPT